VTYEDTSFCFINKNLPFLQEILADNFSKNGIVFRILNFNTLILFLNPVFIINGIATARAAGRATQTHQVLKLLLAQNLSK